MPAETLAVLPFLAALPFMYAPKVLEGDTQPWVLIGTVIALFFYRPRQFLLRKDLGVILVAFAALAAYAARAGFVAETVRAAYIYLNFICLWALAQRGDSYFAAGVRYTLVLWFLVGAYQYAAVQLGLPVEFAGRYVAGRSGVPSLAAEASYFGSLSILGCMYLLQAGRRSDLPFLLLGVLNVLMSGSLLAVLMLVFPFLYLPWRIKILAGSLFLLLFVLDASINEAGLTARLAGFGSAGEGLVALFVDPSLNLRAGHIWYTLWAALPASLSFQNSINFQDSYNAFASSTGILIPTESPYIVTMAGELVHGGGLFGAIIIGILLVSAWRGGSTGWERLIRASFVGACLLNPVSIANPFLVFFCNQRPISSARRPS
jgi:hypothetical protein